DAPIAVKEAVMPWSRFRDVHGRGVDPVLIDRCLDDAVENDGDALYERTELFIGGGVVDLEVAVLHQIHDPDIDHIINNPYGTGGRLDGYEIRTAAVASSVQCLTT
ncbi:hypothetical protein PUR61_12230, partial [Streptomyces sp. BE20]|uniref:hypothetical protein n=1 Tax=Streptomyces sp. BE20 TaxID=3002525 RepID=UPI002E77466E